MFALPQMDEQLPGNIKPLYGWEYQRRPVIPSVTREPIKDLIKSKDWTQEGLGLLAQAVIGM